MFIVHTPNLKQQQIDDQGILLIFIKTGQDFDLMLDYGY